MQSRIRKNDTVVVIAGRERGKRGTVLRVLPKEERAVVERLNMVKKHAKATGPQSPQGIIEKEAPIHLSNLMLLCDGDSCNGPVRVARRRGEDGKIARVCKKCGRKIGGE